MAGQSSQLTRKESARMQKAAAIMEATPGTSGSGMEPECHPATPGVKKNPSSSKGK